MAEDKRTDVPDTGTSLPSGGSPAPSQVTAEWTEYRVMGRGSALFHQGQPVTQAYFLLSGRLKLVEVLASGEEVLLDVLVPAHGPQECSVDGIDSHQYSAVTLSEVTEVASIDQREVAGLGRKHGEVLAWLIRQRSRRLLTAYAALAERRLPVNRRLVFALERLTVDVPVESGSAPVPLSSTDLAHYIQTSQETLSRALKELEESGVIWHEGRQIMVRKAVLRAALSGS